MQAKLKKIEAQKGQVLFERNQAPRMSEETRLLMEQTIGKTPADIVAGVADELVALINEKSFFFQRTADHFKTAVPFTPSDSERLAGFPPDSEAYHMTRSTVALAPLAVPFGLYGSFTAIATGAHGAIGPIGAGVLFGVPSLMKWRHEHRPFEALVFNKD